MYSRFLCACIIRFIYMNISIYTHLFISTFYSLSIQHIFYTHCRFTRHTWVSLRYCCNACFAYNYIWNVNVWMDSMDGWLERMDIQLACRIGTSYYVLYPYV